VTICYLWQSSSHILEGNLLDRIEAISTLVAAVKAGSFSAASRKLGMTLPMVSR
jgi:hypothetical protein